jgi:hypothetical protein
MHNTGMKHTVKSELVPNVNQKRTSARRQRRQRQDYRCCPAEKKEKDLEREAVNDTSLCCREDHLRLLEDRVQEVEPLKREEDGRTLERSPSFILGRHCWELGGNPSKSGLRQSVLLSKEGNWARSTTVGNYTHLFKNPHFF